MSVIGYDAVEYGIVVGPAGNKPNGLASAPDEKNAAPVLSVMAGAAAADIDPSIAILTIDNCYGDARQSVFKGLVG